FFLSKKQKPKAKRRRPPHSKAKFGHSLPARQKQEEHPIEGGGLDFYRQTRYSDGSSGASRTRSLTFSVPTCLRRSSVSPSLSLYCCGTATITTRMVFNRAGATFDSASAPSASGSYRATPRRIAPARSP